MVRKGIWWILGIALVILLPARVLQMSLLLEEDQGLYRDSGQWGMILIGVSLLVAVVLFIIGRQGHWDTSAYRPKPVPFGGAMGILSGIAIAGQSLYAVVQTIQDENASAVGSQPLLVTLSSLVGIFAGISLMAWGTSLLKSGTLLQDYPLTGLVPPIWGCLHLAVLFTVYTAESDVQQNYYAILPFCLAPLFLLAQSSYFSGTGGVKARKKLYQFGAPLVLIGLTSSVPPLICMAFGLPQDSSLSLPLLLVLLMVSLYAATVMSGLRRGDSRSRVCVHRGIPYHLSGLSIGNDSAVNDTNIPQQQGDE